ncbi:MAG: ligase-associated DNA damage response DEXH box helicase [Pseudomonadota bacterium]
MKPQRRASRGDTAAPAGLDAWFASRGWTPAPFQREVWSRFGTGESGLIHAPTGSGKTLAAWGGPILAALARRCPSPKRGPRPLRALWITPLRALAADTHGALQDLADGVGLDWRILRRTGDSGSSERARLARGEADALVTTPESLSLLLSFADAPGRFAALDAVIVDEWHELLGTKRGVLLELALSHLRGLRTDKAGPLRVWGISATLGNLPQALAVLLGGGGHGALVHADMPREVVVDSLLPAATTSFPWAGHLGLVQLPQVLEAIGKVRSTLLFTNTRAQAELWHQALAAVWTDEPATLALHHGSLDRVLRAQVEDGLRAGTLRCVVATSSLDLGVDFATVDQVVQVGSPKGVARLLQRAGRSRHRPGEASRILCVPTHNLELVEIAAARRAVAARRLESRTPLTGCLDVLAQHLAPLATGTDIEEAQALREARDTHAFRTLSDADWRATLQLVEQGGATLGAYPDFRKVARTPEGRLAIASRAAAQRQRLSIGTIVSDSQVAVRWLQGAALGHGEDSGVARRSPGDRFLFAVRTLELLRMKDLTAWVSSARGKPGGVPRRRGGRMPLSTELAAATQALLAEPDPPEPELRLARPMLSAQRALSCLPSPAELLVEIVRARDGEHLFVYPFAGRLAHEGLAALLAFRLARQGPASFSFAVNDYGLVVGGRALPALDDAALRVLLAPVALAEDLAGSLNLAELARRQFREVARVAGLVFQGLPGRSKSMRQLTASSTLLHDVLAEHEPEHVLLRQARDEVLHGQLEMVRLEAALRDAQARTLRLVRPVRLTPFGFPLWAEGIRGQLSSEDWQDRVRRMAEGLESAT